MEVDRSYIDIANAVNVRTISLFPSNRPALNGENWYIRNNQRQQALRQVYIFTAAEKLRMESILLNWINFLNHREALPD